MTIDCPNNKTLNFTSSLLAQTPRKRVHPLVVDGSTTVVSGHTFTSPSLYLQVIGTAAVHDYCTTVGPTLINPIITLPPNVLSTWKPPANQVWDQDNYTVGEIWSDPSNQWEVPTSEGLTQLDLKDLACPTWGLGKSTSADGTVITTIGPPWLPLIVPPKEILSLDQNWASKCTAIKSDQFNLATFALFDPPSALTPASVLLPITPTPTPAPADLTAIREWATPSSMAAKPASLPADPVAPPAKTEDPGKDMPTQSPVTASADPGSLPDNSPTSSKNKGDPPSDPPSNSKILEFFATPGDLTLPSDPKVPITMPLEGENTQTWAKGLGAIIYNAFGEHEPDVDGVKSAVHPMSLPPQTIFTAGAITFTANPTGFRVNNAAVSPGGAAHTVDGTRISLDNSGVLDIGGSTTTLTNPSTTLVLAVAPNPTAFSIAGTTISTGDPAVAIDGTTVSLDRSGALTIGSSTIAITALSYTPNQAYTVAGYTFTPNPSAFSIADTTISAGGPAVTVDGTTISLGQSGALAIGSSTVDLPTQSQTPSNKAYTVADQTFTPNPSAFSIASTTISAGGPAITVGGTIIILQISGTLVVGSSTIPLLTPQATFSSEVDIDGFDVKVDSAFVVVDGVTLLTGAAGVTVSGKVVSPEASRATLDIGTEHFALPTPTGSAANNGSMNVQAFTDGQGKGLGLSLLLVCGVCGTLMLLI